MLQEPRGGRRSAASATATVTSTARGKVPGARGHGPMLLLTPRAASNEPKTQPEEKKKEQSTARQAQQVSLGWGAEQHGHTDTGQEGRTRSLIYPEGIWAACS